MKKFLAILLCFSMLFSIAMAGCAQRDSVKIKYADANTIMELLKSDNLDFGLLPEPAVTMLEKIKAPNTTWYRQSLQTLYNAQTQSYPQAVLMVKSSVLESNPGIVNKIKEKFSANVEWVCNNPTDAVNAVKSKFSSTSLKANVIDRTVVENCKIAWQDALEAKTEVNNYIADILSIKVGLGITPAKQVSDDFFYSTTQTQVGENNQFTFYAPDGAPALAIAKFIADNESFGTNNQFSYNVVNAEDIASYTDGVFGVADFIILPLNVATLKYNNSISNYKMVSVVTHGNLYIVSKTPASLKDLAGKKIGVIGEGKVPDLTLKSILKKNSMGYSTID